MSTLQALFSAENAILLFIKTNQEVSDFVLKRQFNSMHVLHNSPDLYEVIDNLIYEGKVHRVYKNGSQVPFYELCDNTELHY